MIIRSEPQVNDWKLIAAGEQRYSLLQRHVD